MSWHNFKNGEKYPLNQILETCNKHIDSVKVKDKEKKREYLQQIQDRSQAVLEFRPKTQRGWGISPLNPKSWDTLDGQSISRASSAPEDTTPPE